MTILGLFKVGHGIETVQQVGTALAVILADPGISGLKIQVDHGVYSQRYEYTPGTGRTSTQVQAQTFFSYSAV